MTAVGIVAGGTGSRMGATDLPKQFLPLCGLPVIVHTARAFLSNDAIDSVIIGVNPDWYDFMKVLAEKYLSGNVFITKGGSDRNGTVENIIRCAVEKLSAEKDDIILTHDAVRPFVSDKMIADSIKAMEICDICTAAVPATDTMIVSENGLTADSFPLRSTLYNVQTPQTFRMGEFLDIMSSLTDDERKKATDVCRLYHEKGKKVYIIEGTASNIKITYPSDLIMAEAIITKNKNV